MAQPESQGKPFQARVPSAVRKHVRRDLAAKKARLQNMQGDGLREQQVCVTFANLLFTHRIVSDGYYSLSCSYEF